MRNYHQPFVYGPGHETENPVRVSPYAYIANGPVFWSREAFEAAVPVEERWRFTIEAQTQTQVQAQVQEPAQAQTQVTQAPRLEEGSVAMSRDLDILRALCQGKLSKARMIGEYGRYDLFDRAVRECSTRRQVNKLYRAMDESHLYPVNGRFNATERAIRKIRRYERDGLCIETVHDYARVLDEEISRIVNSCS